MGNLYLYYSKKNRKTVMRIYLKCIDIQRLRGCAQSSASRYISLIKDMVGKKQSQRLTIYDLCRVEQLEIEDIKKIIDLSDPMEKFKKVA